MSLFSKSLKICQSTFRSRFFKVCTIDNLVHYSSFPYLILRFKIYNYILISLAAKNHVLKNKNNRGQVLNGLFFLSNDSFATPILLPSYIYANPKYLFCLSLWWLDVMLKANFLVFRRETLCVDLKEASKINLCFGRQKKTWSFSWEVPPLIRSDTFFYMPSK